MRMVTARLISRYDVSFAPGEDGSRLLEHSKDCFGWSCAGLQLVFTPRK